MNQAALLEREFTAIEKEIKTLPVTLSPAITKPPRRSEPPIKIKHTSFFQLPDGRPVEMLFDSQEETTTFVHLEEDESVSYLSEFPDKSGLNLYTPYPPDYSLLLNQVIKFPSAVKNYEDDAELQRKIQSFIHKYLSVSPLFEKLASYYVMMTWIYDNFPEVPYLRAIGDFGSGKTRLLKTLGDICYKSISASGATSLSPMFRLIDEFRGTFILDEADFRFSNEQSELVKVLNNGHAKGMSVLRSEATNGKSFEPRAFQVFGPKILATRGYFDDKALESRFIVEEMGMQPKRTDIPFSLPEEFESEALELRNQLLNFRLKNFGKIKIDPSLSDYSMEGRLNQIVLPLASLIPDKELIQELRKTVQDNFEQTVTERGLGYDGQLLEVMQDLYQSGVEQPTIRQIKELFLSKFANEHSEGFITDRGVGTRMRKSFKVHPKRTGKGYVIPREDKPKLERYFERYGLSNTETPNPLLVEEARDIFDISSQPTLPSL